MLIIHLGLPKSGTSSLQKMVALINKENCLSSSFEYSKNSPSKPTIKNRIVYYCLYRIVNDNDKDFKYLIDNILPILNSYIDDSLDNSEKPLFISQEALSSTWRIKREKIIDRLEICFKKYNRKYILVERNRNSIVKSLYKMRVRDKATILPFHLWKLRHYFSKTNLFEFTNFEKYRYYIQNNIDQSKASLQVLNYELVFKKPYKDLRKIYEILEINESFDYMIKNLSHENISVNNDSSYISNLQKLLFKSAHIFQK